MQRLLPAILFTLAGSVFGLSKEQEFSWDKNGSDFIASSLTRSTPFFDGVRVEGQDTIVEDRPGEKATVIAPKALKQTERVLQKERSADS
jgi:hypothetical protein